MNDRSPNGGALTASFVPFGTGIGTQAPGNGLQYQITFLVAELVINMLETVQVNE